MRRRSPPAVATILLGTLLGQGLVVAVSPILTRTYTATDFGTLAIVTAVASVLGAGATLGVDRALAVVSDREQVRALVVLGVCGVVAVSAGTAAASWAARSTLADRFAAPGLVGLWWVVPVTVAAVGAQRIASAVLARQRRHGAIAVRNACQGVGQVAWNLGMAFAGPIGLVGGLAAGRCAAVLGTVRGRDVLGPIPSLATVRTTASDVRRFLLVTPWSAMLNVVGQQAPSLVIAAVHGSAAAGLVALTMRVLGSPVGMVADAVAQYGAGAFGRLVRDGSPVRGLLVRVTSRLLLLGALAAVVVIASGPTVFGAVFGPEWTESGEFARILVPAFALQVAVSPVSQVLSMLGRQHAQLTWDGARLALTTTAVLVPSAMGAPMSVVLAALAAAMVVSYLAMLSLVLRAAATSGH